VPDAVPGTVAEAASGDAGTAVVLAPAGVAVTGLAAVGTAGTAGAGAVVTRAGALPVCAGAARAM
jgi:hypothetical protein